MPHDAPMLVLNWREEDGPPVTPPQCKGFSRLIAGSVESNLRGRVEQHYERKGLQVRIEVPLV